MENLSTKVAYETPYIKVEENQVIRPDGKPGIYSVVRRPICCVAIALNDKHEICLIQQFRYTIQKECWELPMGGNDGQEPLAAAKRELQEETGLVAEAWQEAGEFYFANGHSDAKGVIFLATRLTQTDKNEQAEEGITATSWCSYDQIKQKIKDGEIDDGPAITSLYLAELKGHLTNS